MNRDDRRRSILKGSESRTRVNKRLSFAVTGEVHTPDTSDTPTVWKRRSYSDIVPTNIQGKLQNLDITPKKDKSLQKKVQSQSSASETVGLSSESSGTKSSASETEGLSFEGNSSLSKNLLCHSVTRTSLGNCYVPQDTSHRPRIRKIDTVLLGQNRRNVFASVLDSFTTSQPTANVLIIGDERIGMKIKEHLVKLHNFETKTQFRTVDILLNITCCSEPDQNQISVGHLFLILMKFDRLESQHQMQNIVKKLREGGVSCHRMVVLSVQPSPGQHCVVVDMEEFTFLLSQHRLICYPWMEEGRPSKTEGERLLGLIHHSVGCGLGTSLLQENIAQVKHKEERDDRSYYHGSLSAIDG